MLKDPFIISSIILAISFVFILIYNHKLKSKVLKVSFLILCLVFLILIIIFDNKFVYEFLRNFIRCFWYPNYFIFTTIVLFSICNLIYTILKKKMIFNIKLINYILFGISFSSYLSYSRLDIDTNSYTSLYSSSSLFVLRVLSISFLIWIILIIIFKFIKRGKYEK